MRIRLFRYNGTISTNSRIDWKRKINVELPTMTYLWNYIKRSHFLQLCFALNTCALELHNFQGRFTQPSTHNNWGTKHNILVQNHLARCKWPIAHSPHTLWLIFSGASTAPEGGIPRLKEVRCGGHNWKNLVLQCRVLVSQHRWALLGKRKRRKWHGSCNKSVGTTPPKHTEWPSGYLALNWAKKCKNLCISILHIH